MSRLKQNILPLVALLGAAVIGAELWLLQRARTEAGQAQAVLEKKKQERDWVARQSPAPTSGNETAIAADLAAARTRLADLRDGLQARSADTFGGPIPQRTTDAFFQLAGLVEQARSQAITTRVSLKPDERFGFAAYANEGPVAELLGPVHRQQLAVKSLLEPLFESRPLALLGVRRTAPMDMGAPGRGGADDFFQFDPGLSLRQAGLVETEPVRLEFTGQTSTLRTFLNGVAALRQTVIVRSVEVEPLPPAGEGRQIPSDAAHPVVGQSLSRFVVTVEFVRLSAAPVSAAP